MDMTGSADAHGTDGAVDPPWEGGDLAHRPVTGTVKSIATELFRRICAELYSFGTRLPSERHLAEEFGVSRNTVYIAKIILLYMGGWCFFCAFTPGMGSPLTIASWAFSSWRP